MNPKEYEGNMEYVWCIYMSMSICLYVYLSKKSEFKVTKVSKPQKVIRSRCFFIFKDVADMSFRLPRRVQVQGLEQQYLILFPSIL